MSDRTRRPGAGSRRARRIPHAILLALACGALAHAAGDAVAPRRHPYPATFPAGSGAPIADRACVLCHSAMLVTQQAKDSLGWEKTLAQMEKWGAPVVAAEHDTLRRWLTERFGPRVAEKP
jgi:cytochrome c5